MILVYIAYRVFTRALTYVMESRPVGFATYGAVAFKSGSISSIVTFLDTFHDSRFPDNSRTWRVFSAFIVCTLYISAMPTLFSAMTGYAAVSAPSVEIPPAGNSGSYDCAAMGGCTIYPCGGPGANEVVENSGGLQKAWGQVLDSMRIHYIEPMPISDQHPGPDEVSVMICKVTLESQWVIECHTED